MSTTADTFRAVAEDAIALLDAWDEAMWDIPGKRVRNPDLCDIDRRMKAAAEADEWQPISTAPKMKTLLLFAVTDVGDDGKVNNWKMATGSWSTGYENDEKRTPWEWDGRQLMKYEIQPTHWRLLPAAPAPAAAIAKAEGRA